MAILPENETYDFESRTYINPQVSLNEQNAFVDNLRNVQKTNTDQINMQTYNLGTAVPSSVGGLTGANSYFSSRYQTPQTNSLAANLRATAQAKALNDVLADEQAKMQKRYNDAYHTSQIRGSNGGGSGGGNGGNKTNPISNGEVEIVTTDDDQGTTSSVGQVDRGTPLNPQMQYSYTLNGKTYFINVYGRTAADPSRDRWWVTATTDTWPYTQHFKGTKGLDFLNSIIEKGGKIYNASGGEVSPNSIYAL